MDNKRPFAILNIPEISAIYFALLQCGYDYYTIERSQEHIGIIREFVCCRIAPNFFSGTKQNTCQVYPYWPRAAILETACFHLSPNRLQFQDYDTFRENIVSAGNIADYERDQRLWDWIENFPTALCKIFDSDAFHRYMKWENKWIAEQNTKYGEELRQIQSCLDVCVNRYRSPVQDIQIVINPIKCVYSADYYLNKRCFIFSSGALHADSVIHEFLHHVVHPAILKMADMVLTNKRIYPDIDTSYYLSGDAAGQINAFEEFAVRELTKDVFAMNYPKDLTNYLKMLLCS